MKSTHQRIGIILVTMAITVAALSVVGCNDKCSPVEKQRIIDSVMTDLMGVSGQQQLLNPDFTDMGVGSLLSSGRMRMSSVDYGKLVDSIEKVLRYPTNRLNASLPDICMPPNHWGSYGMPAIPSSTWWNPLNPNQVEVLTQTQTSSPTVIDNLKMYMLNFYMQGRIGSNPPTNMTFELIGLNYPLSMAPPFHGFTSVLPPLITPTGYRVQLNY